MASPLRDELEGILGPRGLAALSAARGGLRIYVPSMARDTHWLAETVGLEAAKRLAFRFGGCRLHVPTSRSVGRDARDARIRELRRQGLPVARIAAETGVSERTAWLVVRARPD